MLPVPLFNANVDGAANVAVVEGINDNVTQTRDAQGNVDRHPATFTGLDGLATLRLTARDADTQSIQIRARTQVYVGLDSVPTPAPNASLSLSYGATFTTSPRGALAVSATASATSIASARTGDGNFLLTLDPTASATSVASYGLFLTYSYALAPRWTFSQYAGGTVTNTLSAPPLQAANGVVLERGGIDGVLPSATTSLGHELGKRDTGTVSVNYRYVYSPYALSIGTNPPQLAGPQSIHQVGPSVGLTHAFSETVTTTTAVGFSMTTPQAIDPDQRIVVFPTGSEQLTVTGSRWTVRSLASLSYSSVSARLGAGPTVAFTGSISGAPIQGRAYRALHVVGSVQATHSSVPAAGGGSASIEALGAGVEARYGLTRWLGIYSGYDLRGTSSFVPGDPATIRQIFFLGLSGYFTTDGNLPPIETTPTPYTPG